MRLFELELKSEPELNEPENFLEFIKTHASEYIRQNPKWMDEPLYRGLHEIEDDSFILPNIENRKPKNTNPVLNNLIDESMKRLGFKATRSNSIFATSAKSQATNYGRRTYSVIPLGSFDFTWSDKVFDLFIYVDLLYKEGYVEFDETQNIKFMVGRTFAKKYNIEQTDNYTLSEILNLNGPENYKKMKSDFYYYLTPKNMEYMIELGYTFKDIKIDEFFKKYEFKNSNLSSAINSQNEILIRANSYLYVPLIRWTILIEKLKNTLETL